MATEKRLIPDGKKVTLEELLPGTIFAYGNTLFASRNADEDCIAVKSEYRCSNGLIEAFIIDSGEQFWGGAKTAKEQNKLMVQPLTIEEVDAVEVPCKIGDFVWAIRNFKGKKHPQRGIVSDMYFSKDMSLQIVVKYVARGEWGKTVFATDEEVYAAIKERKENER